MLKLTHKALNDVYVCEGSCIDAVDAESSCSNCTITLIIVDMRERHASAQTKMYLIPPAVSYSFCHAPLALRTCELGVQIVMMMGGFDDIPFQVICQLVRG